MSDIDDEITLADEIETTGVFDDVEFEEFNTKVLRRFRQSWKGTGCTSKIRRIQAKLVVEITGPANAALDAMNDVRLLRGGMQIHRKSVAAMEKVAKVRARGDLAFICDAFHVVGVPDQQLVRNLLANKGTPRCVECSGVTRLVKSVDEAHDLVVAAILKMGTGDLKDAAER